MDSSKYFKIFEFSLEVGVSPRTVRTWCDAGKILYKRLPNGYRMIPVSEIERAKKIRRKRHNER